MDLGLSAINALYKSSGLSTNAKSILRPTDGSHWSAPYHNFGEETALVISAEKSYHDYNYKTEFQICKENKEFKRQNILMS